MSWYQGWAHHVKVVGPVVQEHQVEYTSFGQQVLVSRLGSWQGVGVGQVPYFWEGREIWALVQEGGWVPPSPLWQYGLVSPLTEGLRQTEHSAANEVG